MAHSARTILMTVPHMAVTMELVLMALIITLVSVIQGSMVYHVRQTLMNAKVSRAIVEYVKIFLGHTTVSVISGLQAKTVRLTLMNVIVEIPAMRTRNRVRVVALTSMNPATLVQNAKDLNVSVGMASQAQNVRQISMTVNLKISHVKTEPLALMELWTTLVTACLVTQDGTALLTLMSVSLDSARITQHVITQSITTPVTVYQASRTSTVQQILMNVNQTLV